VIEPYHKKADDVKLHQLISACIVDMNAQQACAASRCHLLIVDCYATGDAPSWSPLCMECMPSKGLLVQGLTLHGHSSTLPGHHMMRTRHMWMSVKANTL
jgi:hypothetical protein